MHATTKYARAARNSSQDIFEDSLEIAPPSDASDPSDTSDPSAKLDFAFSHALVDPSGFRLLSVNRLVGRSGCFEDLFDNRPR